MKSLLRATVLSLITVSLAHGQCPGDVVPNGVVNGTDLAEVLGSWGSCSSCAADINGDSQVNAIDLAILLGGWGPCRPVISSISPSQGHINGGNQITISGHYLAGATAVTVGGLPASGFTVVSENSVRAITPSGPPGPATVSVTTRAGQGSLSGGFEFVQVVVPPWATLIQSAPDASVIIDPQIRAAVVATGYAWRVRHTATQIEMLLVPKGVFQMGCSPSSTFSCFADESPVHTVAISQPFYLGRFEVTQAQWQARMGSNPSWFGGASSSTRPVEQVSWDTIQSFLSATGMRLPTEAEWEHAYRAGTVTAYHSTPSQPNGTNDTTRLWDMAWFGENSSGQTHPVGQKSPNGLGLYDMSGNVWEWVNDLHGSYSASAQIDPPGAVSGPYRVLRGGSFSFSSSYSRSSARGIGEPYGAANFIGFRVARNP